MTRDRSVASDNSFAILSDETRLATLQALVERLREHPDDPTLGFADLRRSIDLRDSGNFNYHLSQLEGRFVTKTDDGYRIAPAGIQVVAALIAGIYGEGNELGPVEINDECPVCGEPLTATYENSLFKVTCENDHEFRNTLAPGAVDQRTLKEVIELLTLTTKQHLELAANGICPFCQGRLEWSIEPNQETAIREFENQCSRCGVRIEIPVIMVLLQHPAAVAFYYEQGINIRDRPLWAPVFHNPVQAFVATEPVRIHISLKLDSADLEATLDKNLSIIDIDT